MENFGKDLESAVTLLKDLPTKLKPINGLLSSLTEQVENGRINTSKGISFFETKYQLLLSYVANITHLMCQKVQGRSLKNEASVARLIEIRTILEKMRPIEQKLKYQVDKLIKTATTGIAEDDPLRLRPDAENIMNKDDGESGSENEKKEPSRQLYRAPKLAPVVYDGDEKEKREKELKRKRRWLASSSIMEDLRDDQSGEKHSLSFLSRKRAHKEKERTEFEETHMQRLNLTKKERHLRRMDRSATGLEDIIKFDRLPTLDHDLMDDVTTKRTKGKIKGKYNKSLKRRKLGR